MAIKRQLADLIHQKVQASDETNVLRDYPNDSQTLENQALTQQVQRLEKELTQLRSGQLGSSERTILEQQISQLTAQLTSQSGIQSLPLHLIQADPKQPRQTISLATVQERAESLHREGQKSPIIVIPQDGQYVLFDGELRWRAASKLRWETLKAVCLPTNENQNEAEVFEGQLVTSIQSQKLHDLDLARGLVRLIVYKHPHFENREVEIPKILNTAIRRLQRSARYSELAQIRISDSVTQQAWLETAGLKDIEEHEIFEVLLGKQLHPATISTTVFPMLELAEDLKQYIQSEGLEASKARELNRLSDQQLRLEPEAARSVRVKATQQVIEAQMTLSKVKILVNTLIAQHNPQPESQITAIALFTKTLKGIELHSASPAELKDLEVALKNKLEEVRQLKKQ